jgi:hypothetical protein
MGFYDFPFDGSIRGVNLHPHIAVGISGQEVGIGISSTDGGMGGMWNGGWEKTDQVVLGGNRMATDFYLDMRKKMSPL